MTFRRAAALIVLLAAGFVTAVALGQGAAETTTVVTVTDPDRVVTIPGAIHDVTLPISTVTVTVTGTTTTTTQPPTTTTTTTTTVPPPPPSGPACNSASWPAGSLLPARIAESTGSVINVSTSAGLRSALGSVNPGQIVRLAAGHYGAGEAAYSVSRSGTAAAPITIEGAGGAVLDTTLKVSASYVRVRNLEIDGSTRSDENGVYGPGGSNVELCGLYIHDVTRGGQYAQGIITSSSTSNWQIINVRIERIGDPNATQFIKEHEHGCYLNGTGYLLANVLIKDVSGFGCQLYPSLDNSILTHVTLVGSRTKSGLINTSGSTGNRIVNSIAVGNASYGYEGSIPGDHLIAFGNGGGQFSLSSCSACLTANPLLDSSSKPQAGSPAIGHSDPRYSPGFDLAGNPRPASPTAGAYER